MGSDEVARGQTRLNGVKCGQGISSVAVYMYKLMVTDDEENMSMYKGIDHKNVHRNRSRDQHPMRS